MVSCQQYRLYGICGSCQPWTPHPTNDQTHVPLRYATLCYAVPHCAAVTRTNFFYLFFLKKKITRNRKTSKRKEEKKKKTTEKTHHLHSFMGWQPQVELLDNKITSEKKSDHKFLRLPLWHDSIRSQLWWRCWQASNRLRCVSPLAPPTIQHSHVQYISSCQGSNHQNLLPADNFFIFKMFFNNII